ncbi:LAFE_0B10638g1_1 [Lachancea fermentati]|uniref:LAFE_0B10638g1_1 n=1 Tax=Lachancea fermentati TaxID=4955 RepID=A0A1G4M8M1_LACFM|nr:LAFE_0B10638g1_1 [Lachancea fermentati]
MNSPNNDANNNDKNINGSDCLPPLLTFVPDQSQNTQDRSAPEYTTTTKFALAQTGEPNIEEAGKPAAIELSLLKTQIELQSTAINLIGNKVKHVENEVNNHDSGVNDVLANLTSTVKNLMHNQHVLENKFEDLLRNQSNTDSVVNSLFDKIDQVSQFLTKAVKNNSLASAPVQPVHRGPGRPPKNRNNLTNVIAALSVTNKETLPNGTITVAKNKRYFVDPDEQNLTEEQTPIQAKAAKKPPPNADPNAPPVKKRGPGRPPKRKHHWAKKAEVAAQSAPSSQPNSADGDATLKVEPKDLDRENSPEVPASDASVPHEGSASLSESNFMTDQEKQENGKQSPSQPKAVRQNELERRRDSREQMLVSMKYSDRDKAKSFMESNKDLLKAMRDDERKKRMTAFIYENQSNGGTPSTTTANTPSPRSLSSTRNGQSSQQLVSSQYSVSSDAANKEVEETAQEEMTDGESFPEDHETATPPSVSELTAEPITEPLSSSMLNHSEVATPLPTIPPRKVGIMSMLNNDEEEEVMPQKRKLPEIFKSNSTAENARKKEKLDDDYKRDFRSMIPMLPEKKDNRGRPANSSSSGDNSTALLLASPIELICRDGYFYRRSDPQTPISTGAYLEFKFKSKEDELIRLTMNEEDYAELTRQDRINAYFLKPDIEIETDFASSILSKITLTEKYVNSLEYFLMEFRWENKLVGLGLKLRESKRTWQRRKALFALFEFWRDKSREKRGFSAFTILHAVKEMENYRIFINRSVSWFYNHITLLKMILFDLCDNTDTQWREWMFPKGEPLPVLGDGVTEDNINEAIDNVLTLDFLEDGTENREVKPSVTQVTTTDNLNM